MAKPLSPTAQRVIDAINKPSERDLQVKVGPSEIGNPCQLCLAERLLASHLGEAVEPRPPSIAPWLGTAAHEKLEWLDLPDTIREAKVSVGTIEGIGEVTGKVDLFDLTTRQVVDYKFMGKKRIAGIARAFITRENNEVIFDDASPYVGTLKQYYVQQMLYAKGIEEAFSTPVESVSLLLFPRDATIEDFETGVTELRFAYDFDVASAMLTRASEILTWALQADSLNELESDANCYYCNRERGKDWDLLTN